MRRWHLDEIAKRHCDTTQRSRRTMPAFNFFFSSVEIQFRAKKQKKNFLRGPIKRRKTAEVEGKIFCGVKATWYIFKYIIWNGSPALSSGERREEKENEKETRKRGNNLWIFISRH